MPIGVIFPGKIMYLACNGFAFFFSLVLLLLLLLLLFLTLEDILNYCLDLEKLEKDILRNVLCS